MCSIGQTERCEATGCEWKKVFGIYCWQRSPEVKAEVKVVTPAIWSPKFVPAESTNPFYVKRRKKGRVVKEEKKYTEVKTPEQKENTVPLKTKDNFFNEIIKVAEQDDWIKKIRVLKNENKIK